MDTRTLTAAFSAKGGTATGGEIYGEMTKASFQRVVECLIEKAELGPDSCFLDIGAGLGKPNMHVAVYPGVKHSIGIEILPVIWHVGVNRRPICPNLRGEG
eukprot:1395554-Amorphochlora_amoeboformis.AAC.2